MYMVAEGVCFIIPYIFKKKVKKKKSLNNFHFKKITSKWLMVVNINVLIALVTRMRSDHLIFKKLIFIFFFFSFTGEIIYMQTSITEKKKCRGKNTRSLT